MRTSLSALTVAALLALAPTAVTASSGSAGDDPEVYVGALDGVALHDIHCETCFEGGGDHVFAGVACGAGGGTDAQPDGLLASFAGVIARVLPLPPHIGGGEEDCYTCHPSFGDSCHDNPLPGDCGIHDGCHPDEDLQDLKVAILAEDMVAFQEVVARGTLNLQINRQRSAVQVKDCDNRIAGQYVVAQQWLALADI